MPAPDSTLGATIRAWRDRMPPAAAGLPERRGRRSIGLRREDLADLAGVSVDYLVRLEQGRATAPSAQVVASLARALQLSRPERDHLYRLACLGVPSTAVISEHVPPGVQRLVQRLTEAAVGVFAADWQLIWWNHTWAALLGDPSSIPRRLRNFARTTFPVPGQGPSLAQWPVDNIDTDITDAAVVSDLRRASGHFPDDPRLSTLIGELIDGNSRFAHLWAQGSVNAHREDYKVVHHPSVGPIGVNCDVLTDGDLELKIVVLSAAPGTADESKLRLAAVTGAPELAVPTHEHVSVIRS